MHTTENIKNLENIELHKSSSNSSNIWITCLTKSYMDMNKIKVSTTQRYYIKQLNSPLLAIEDTTTKPFANLITT